MAVQVEIAVVGQIDDGLLLGDATVVDPDGVFIGEGVGHGNVHSTGVALVAVGAVEAEGDGIFGGLLDLPDPEAPEIQTAVQVVGAVVHRQLVELALQGELALADPVGVPAHGGAEEGTGGALVAGGIVIAQNHVQEALFRGNQHMEIPSSVVFFGDTEGNYGFFRNFSGGVVWYSCFCNDSIKDNLSSGLIS